MHPGRMTLTFISLAAVTELLTVLGVAYLSNRDVPEKLVNIGSIMTRASLVLQLVISGLFFLMMGLFHRCCHEGKITSRKVMRPLFTLYASMLLVLARTIFAMVKHFGEGKLPIQADAAEMETLNPPPIVRYEWYTYVFEATPLFLALFIWNVLYPRPCLPQSSKSYLAQDGSTELKGPGWKDPRGLTETFFDPFSALTNRGGHQKQFWEANGYALGRKGKVRTTAGTGMESGLWRQ